VERAVLRIPNPAPHVVPIATKSLRERGVRLATQQMKRLHRATFGHGHSHFARSTSSPGRRLSEHVEVPQAALQFEPE